MKASVVRKSESIACKERVFVDSIDPTGACCGVSIRGSTYLLDINPPRVVLITSMPLRKRHCLMYVR